MKLIEVAAKSLIGLGKGSLFIHSFFYIYMFVVPPRLEVDVVWEGRKKSEPKTVGQIQSVLSAMSETDLMSERGIKCK